MPENIITDSPFTSIHGACGRNFMSCECDDGDEGDLVLCEVTEVKTMASSVVCMFCDAIVNVPHNCDRYTVYLAKIGHEGAREAIVDALRWLHQANDQINREFLSSMTGFTFQSEGFD